MDEYKGFWVDEKGSGVEGWHGNGYGNGDGYSFVYGFGNIHGGGYGDGDICEGRGGFGNGFGDGGGNSANDHREG